MRGRVRAFTLVELLVVIGIIGLLISILLPALSKAQDAAKTVQCASNLRQIATALISYSNDNKGRLIPDMVQGSGVSTIYPQGFFWANALVTQKYLRAPQGVLSATAVSPIPKTGSSVFYCPCGINDSFSFGGRNSTGVPDNTGGDEPWNGPVSGGAFFPRSAYDNYAHFYNTANTAIFGTTPDDVACWYALNTTVTNTPANVYVAPGNVDSPFIWFQQANGSVDGALEDPRLQRSLSLIKKSAAVVMVLDGAADNMTWVPTGYGVVSRIAGRHGLPLNGGRDGICNMAFFDGHVEGISTVPFTNYQNNVNDSVPQALEAQLPSVIFYLHDQ